MIVDRHPQVRVISGEVEIGLDERGDAVTCAPVEPLADEFRPLVEGAGVDRKQKVIDAGKQIVDRPYRIADLPGHMAGRELGETVLGHLPMAFRDDQLAKLCPAVIRPAAHYALLFGKLNTV